MKGPFAKTLSIGSATGKKTRFSRLMIGAIVIVGALGLQGCFEQNAKDSGGSLISTENASKDIQVSLHPLSQNVYTAKSITLNTSASGTGVLKYQWLKDGEVIPNAVRSSFTINNATPADEGVYCVRITSGQSVLITKTATLKVTRDTGARLSWDMPSKRADGSLLPAGEIAAYRILHITDDESFKQNYEVEGYLQNYEISNLAAGTHYFAIVTVDVNGMESATSEFVTKRII